MAEKSTDAGGLGDDIIGFIEAFCRVPEGARVGEPIELAEFQRRFIRDAYRPGVRRAYLSIARKNGKTSLSACLLLAHLVGPAAHRNAQLVSGAQSEPQAKLVFDLMRKMIELEPVLQAQTTIRYSPRSIRGLAMGTEYRPIAAKAETAYGLSPQFALLDEVGQVAGERDEFVTAIETAQGAYDEPLLLAISTQAASDGALFSLWLDSAAANPDGRTVSHVYAAPPDCDLLDEAAWRAANPAMGLFCSQANIEAAMRDADAMPSRESDARNLILNQRVERFDPYVSVAAWRGCGSPPLNTPPLRDTGEPGAMAWSAGLDLSQARDLTAWCRVGMDQDGVIHAHPRFWLPADGIRTRARLDREPYDRWAEEGYIDLIPGPVVDFAQVAPVVLADLREYDIGTVAFDRWQMARFVAALMAAGATQEEIERFREFGQGFASMTPALRALDEKIYAKMLRHGDHPVLTMCARNAVVEGAKSGVSRKLTKVAASRRIDGMVALVMGVAVQEGEPAEVDSMYDDPEVLQALDDALSGGEW